MTGLSIKSLIVAGFMANASGATDADTNFIQVDATDYSSDKTPADLTLGFAKIKRTAQAEITHIGPFNGKYAVVIDSPEDSKNSDQIVLLEDRNGDGVYRTGNHFKVTDLVLHATAPNFNGEKTLSVAGAFVYFDGFTLPSYTDLMEDPAQFVDPGLHTIGNYSCALVQPDGSLQFASEKFDNGGFYGEQKFLQTLTATFAGVDEPTTEHSFAHFRKGEVLFTPDLMGNIGVSPESHCNSEAWMSPSTLKP